MTLKISIIILHHNKKCIIFLCYCSVLDVNNLPSSWPITDEEKFVERAGYDRIIKLTKDMYYIRQGKGNCWSLVKRDANIKRWYVCDCQIGVLNKLCAHQNIAMRCIHRMDLKPVTASKDKTTFHVKRRQLEFWLYVEPWQDTTAMPTTFTITRSSTRKFKCNCHDNPHCHHIKNVVHLIAQQFSTSSASPVASTVPAEVVSSPKMKTHPMTTRRRKTKAPQSMPHEEDNAYQNHIGDVENANQQRIKEKKENRPSSFSSKPIYLMPDQKIRCKFTAKEMSCGIYPITNRWQNLILQPNKPDEPCKHEKPYELHQTYDVSWLMIDRATLVPVIVRHYRTAPNSGCDCVVYYDGRDDFIFNYNNKHLFSHVVLFRWLVSFQYVRSTMYSFCYTHNFVCQLLCYNGEGINSTACAETFKAFLRLIDFRDEAQKKKLFSCDKCAQSQKLFLAMDGIQLGSKW